MSPTMSAPRRALKIPLTKAQWVILILLVLSVTINYIDRGSLSAADKYLEQDFGLDPQRRGEIYSAFFAGYAGLMLLAGWLVDQRDSAHRRSFRFRDAHCAAAGARRR
jgi:ACS family D-galactonate transporter-like MFS transporter